MNKTATIIAWLAITVSAMAQTTTFSGATRIGTDWQHTKTFSGGTVRESFEDWRWQHTSGTNANQMSAFTRSYVTLAGSATNTHAITNMVNSFGDTVAFDKVRFLRVESDTDNAHNIVMGGAASNPWTGWGGGTDPTITLAPGGMLLMIAPSLAGYAVATNSYNLQFVNQGTNSVVYEIYIGGSQ